MTDSPGVGTDCRCIVTKCPAATADGHRIGRTNAEETEAGFSTVTNRQTAFPEGGSIATDCDIAVFICRSVEADRRGASPFGQALRAGRGAVVAQRICNRAIGRGLIATGLRADARCRCGETICVCTGTERGATNPSRCCTGLHRHAAYGDQRIAVFIHRIAANSDRTRADGLCVLAEGCCVLTRCQSVQADGGCAIGKCIGTAAEGRCSAANRIGGFA
ncbi:hypothetical protein D3C81_1400330 [compost metagenome]